MSDTRAKNDSDILEQTNSNAAIVGAVIIGRNEGERLGRCIESVKSQVEHIVYVDSNSSDGSVVLAEGIGVDVICLTDGPFTAARGRQAGLESLVGKIDGLRYVLFIDGDCILREGWLVRACEYLEANERVAGVCGRRREEYPEKTIYNSLVDVDWNIPVGDVAYFGGDSVVRVEAMYEVGGWPIKLIAGEEPDMCFRMEACGWRIVCIDYDATLHDVAMTRFIEYWQRSIRSGHAYIEVGLRNRHSGGRRWLRMVASIVTYGLIWPIVMLISAFIFWPITILILLLYVRLFVLLMRYCRSWHYSVRVSMIYAVLNIVCKFSGAIGVWRFIIGRLSKKRSTIIEYKAGGNGA